MGAPGGRHPDKECRMATELVITPDVTPQESEAFERRLLLTRLEDIVNWVVNWARRSSIWPVRARY